MEHNIKPKLEVLTEFGFYRSIVQYECAEPSGAGSPRARSPVLQG